MALDTLSALFEQQLGKHDYHDLLSNPSPRNYLAAGKKLSWETIQPHYQHLAPLELSPEHKTKYTQGVMRAMSSDTDDLVKDSNRTLETM
ncbi:hypothetical protein FQN57_004658 [Myotisia sp. PD_48]|nr:hypothetical protein FQN57_004658 [Myotisia sp. PD_48]